MIDPCTKCHFIWKAGGVAFWWGGGAYKHLSGCVPDVIYTGLTLNTFQCWQIFCVLALWFDQILLIKHQMLQQRLYGNVCVQSDFGFPTLSYLDYGVIRLNDPLRKYVFHSHFIMLWSIWIPCFEYILFNALRIQNWHSSHNRYSKKFTKQLNLLTI